MPASSDTVKVSGMNYTLEDIPALVQKIEELEKSLEEYKQWNEHLQSKLKKRTLEKAGKRGRAAWHVRLDEKTNRIYLMLSGNFTYPTARTATMHILTVLSHARIGFDIITDISNLFPSLEKRAIFHVKKMLYNMRYMGLKRAVLVRNPKAPQVSEAFENQVKTVYGPSSMVPAFDDVEEAENFLTR
jgi:hypothetical protein